MKRGDLRVRAASTMVAGCVSSRIAGLTVIVGTRLRRQTTGCSSS